MKKLEQRVPNLRFKGFTDDWEQHKLGDIAKVTKLAGFEFTKYINYSSKGKILAIRGLNIKDGKFNLQDVKYIDNSDFNKLTRSKLRQDDILFTYVGTIGNSAIVPAGVKWYLAPNVCLIRTQTENAKFISHLIQSDKFQHQEIPKWITTSSQPALSMENIRKFSIILPTISEQLKISNLVSIIDTIITLQQRKLDLLKQLKKGLLQKMFADKGSKRPILRFNGFTDDWEERKLGDIALFSKGKGISKKDLHTHGIYNIVHYADIYKFMPVQDKVLHHSNNKMGVRIGSNSLLFAGSDVTPKGLARTTAIKQENVRVGGDVIIADLSEKHINYFMSYEINMNKRFIYPFITGSTVRHIHGSDLSHLNITFPSLSEQKSIAHIFNLIEHELSLLKIKKSKYQSIKKSLLQQMFI